MNYQGLLVALILVLSTAAQGREKTDVIHLLNGDRITGEIKQLVHGRLSVKTDGMGTVNVEWDDIESIESDYEFEFEDTDGTRYYGTAVADGHAELLVIPGARGNPGLDLNRVVRITPIEASFLERFDGSMSLGYSYTKASDVSQFSFGLSTSYRTPERGLNLSLSSIITSDEDDETTEREDVNAQLIRYRDNRWFRAILLSLEKNDELGLDLRTGLGYAVGRFVVQSNVSELALSAGVLASRESFIGDAASEENVELLFASSYSRYIYDDPNVNISATLSVFPSLTDSGRVRAQLDARVRYELIDDLFLDFSIYDSYDNEPPLGVSSTNDYGVVTSLGWSF